MPNVDLPGDWGPDWYSDPTGTRPNNGPQVQGNDVFSNATIGTGEDKWSGFFQNIIGTTVGYAIRKDAAQSGLVPATASNGQPVYTGVAAPYPVAGYAPQPQGMSINANMLLIGGAILGAVLLIAKKA